MVQDSEEAAVEGYAQHASRLGGPDAGALAGPEVFDRGRLRRGICGGWGGGGGKQYLSYCAVVPIAKLFFYEPIDSSFFFA